jgi:uncharacterized YccA/Bax inhibitor family protein
MFRGVTTLGLILGMLIGFPAGMAYAVGRRAWRDVAGAKRLVGGARRTAWHASRVMVAWLVGVAVLVVAAVAWAAGGGAGTPLCPRPSTSAAAQGHTTAAVGTPAPGSSPTCEPR